MRREKNRADSGLPESALDSLRACCPADLYGFLAGLFRADAHGLIDGADEDFSVANFAGFGGFDDGCCSLVHEMIGNDGFQFDLR